jgi:hypothetical protein
MICDCLEKIYEIKTAGVETKTKPEILRKRSSNSIDPNMTFKQKSFYIDRKAGIPA